MNKSITPSAARISEVARCIRALHEHRRQFGAQGSDLPYGEAIRCLGERRRLMREQLAAHTRKVKQ